MNGNERNLPPMPVVTWQISPFVVQWIEWKRGDKPGMLMLWARRLKSGMWCHTAASWANLVIVSFRSTLVCCVVGFLTRLMMNTLGLIGSSSGVLDEIYCRVVNDFEAEDNGRADALANSRATTS
jgi:hypothetical protein